MVVSQSGRQKLYIKAENGINLSCFQHIPYSGKFGESTLFEHLAKKFDKLIDQQGLLIVNTSLDDFTLANLGYLYLYS